jgi:tRNA pseudouridine13 synthase
MEKTGWPRANSESLRVTGVVRFVSEDFEVTESLVSDPMGSGEHLYVYVRKRDVTTREVQKLLALSCDVPLSEVSYAGMKDKRVVAHQWFSIRRPARESFVLDDRVRVLRCSYHQRKLRRGELAGNRFRVVVRDVSCAVDELEANLNRVRRHGVPNYFGPQRFGSDKTNVMAALG